MAEALSLHDQQRLAAYTIASDLVAGLADHPRILSLKGDLYELKLRRLDAIQALTALLVEHAVLDVPGRAPEADDEAPQRTPADDEPLEPGGVGPRPW